MQTILGSGGTIGLELATIEGVSGTVLMVAVADRPVEFGPTEQDLCSVFFVLLSPPGMGGEHVRVLARIARLASDVAVVERLRSAPSEAALKQEIEAMDGRR